MKAFLLALLAFGLLTAQRRTITKGLDDALTWRALKGSFFAMGRGWEAGQLQNLIGRAPATARRFAVPAMMPYDLLAHFCVAYLAFYAALHLGWWFLSDSGGILLILILPLTLVGLVLAENIALAGLLTGRAAITPQTCQRARRLTRARIITLRLAVAQGVLVPALTVAIKVGSVALMMNNMRGR